MAVAPLGGPPDAAFARLADIAARFRVDHPTATVLSAGMSDDLESADLVRRDTCADRQRVARKRTTLG